MSSKEDIERALEDAKRQTAEMTQRIRAAGEATMIEEEVKKAQEDKLKKK